MSPLDPGLLESPGPETLEKIRNTPTADVAKAVYEALGAWLAAGFVDYDVVWKIGVSGGSAAHVGLDRAVHDWQAGLNTPRARGVAAAFCSGYWSYAKSLDDSVAAGMERTLADLSRNHDDFPYMATLLALATFAERRRAAPLIKTLKDQAKSMRRDGRLPGVVAALERL